MTSLARLGCLVVAGVTACATPVASSGAVTAAPMTPAAAPTASAPGAPVVLASATVRNIKQASQPSAGTASGKSGQATASGPGVAQAVKGNPAGGVAVPAAAAAVATSHPDRVIGNGTPASCTSAAVVAAVAAGGVITFRCGSRPVTIPMTATATVASGSHQVVLDGGGKVTLSGRGKTRILFMNAGWRQRGPQLIVENLTFTDAYSGTRQAAGSTVYGGGAIFAEGGQLKVVNSAFVDNSCYRAGPDLGGGAIRAVGMDPASPVYITSDTFTGNSCSNGGALSGLFARFDIINSVLTDNKAIGNGANPAKAGTSGGGSGGGIYTDGARYSLTVSGTVMRGNTAREGGGAIFFVVNYGGGMLRIQYSTLQANTSGAFENAPGIFDSVNGRDTRPIEVGSTVG